MYTFPSAKRRRGFTLIELLVVIAIIAILMSLLLATIGRAYTIAQVTQCKSNLKNIGGAVKIYETTNQCLPPYSERKNFTPTSGGGGPITVSVFYQLLPFLELDSLTQRFYPTATATRITVFTCPVDGNTGTGDLSSIGGSSSAASSNYVANAAIFRGNVDPITTPTAPVNIRFNSPAAMIESSSTIIVSEHLQVCTGNNSGVLWASPANSLFQVPGFSNGTLTPGSVTGLSFQIGVSSAGCNSVLNAQHPIALNVLRGDGQVSQITRSFDAPNLNYYCIGVGRETLTAPTMMFP